MFADDIVLVAESLEDLQRMADVLAEHARQWRYEVSLKKTKYMCFSHPAKMSSRAEAVLIEGKSIESGQPSQPIELSQLSQQCKVDQRRFQLLWDDREPIERVSCYKYLGVLLTETLDWNKHKRHMFCRTADAVDGARRKGIRHMQPLQAGYVWSAPAPSICF